MTVLLLDPIRRSAVTRGAKHVITRSPGSDAFILRLEALGLQAGGIVICTPFTLAATASWSARMRTTLI